MRRLTGVLIPVLWVGLVACGSPVEPMKPPGSENCSNQKDDNGDQKVDCADPTCLADPACAVAMGGGGGGAPLGGGTGGGGGMDVDAGRDAGFDAGVDAGIIDAGIVDAGTDAGLDAGADAGIDAGIDSGVPVETSCSDGNDNDLDGKTDCLDPDCIGAGTENCTDGIDNTCEGAIDCGNPKCTANAVCLAQVDGKPCLTDAHCAGGKCDTEAATGSPNGKCTNLTSCNATAQTGCNGGLCLAGTGFNTCQAHCTGTGMGATGRCRPGYACRDADLVNTNANNYCTPLCTSDSECVAPDAGYGCNPWSTRCGPKDLGLLKYGAACTMSTQCETGLCATGTSWPGGSCVGFCRGDVPTCGTDGACAFFASYGDNVGGCFDRCTTPPVLGNTQCRNGYQCRPRGAATFCACGVTGEVCAGATDCCSGVCNGTACQ